MATAISPVQAIAAKLPHAGLDGLRVSRTEESPGKAPGPVVPARLALREQRQHDDDRWHAECGSEGLHAFHLSCLAKHGNDVGG
jgi:hypothetical protein